jgi:putative protein-disulfide isomerase
MKENSRLIYVHDPMCSWCWGFSPTLARLRRQLPTALEFASLLGGLAADSEQPMPMALQEKLQDTWQRIQERIPGTRFNFDFWRDCRPRRSTWPACRAVIVARQLNPACEQAMIEAIQHAYYLEARNPSDSETLVALAAQLGLDAAVFGKQLHALETRELLAQEMRASRGIGADSFPSLRLQIADSYWPVPIDYLDPAPMLEVIRSLLDD